jgi:ubiquitin carboxyl-terminal hydrolase 3
MNDTLDNILEELRQELKDDSDGISETSSTLEEISSSKSTPETVSSTTSSSSDSGWEEPPLIGRKLRPRKRTISSDNNSDTQTQPPQQKQVQPPQHKRNKLKKVVGLRNLGNTCFMNSVLQSLSNIREFSCYFNKLPSLETTKMLQQKQQKTYHSRSMKENLDDVFVVEELRKVLLHLSQGGDGTKGAISPECLFLVIWKVVPQFRGHRQHDAHEFLRYMLDRLHTELQQVSYLPTDLNASLTGSPTTATTNSKDSKPSSTTTTTNNSIFNLSPNISHLNKTQRNSIVTNVFGGTLQSEVRCLVCGMESKKHDPFLDLSLDIPEKFYKDSPSEESNSSKSHAASGVAATPTAGGVGCDNSKPKKPICHISDCLSSFTEVSALVYRCLTVFICFLDNKNILTFRVPSLTFSLIFFRLKN